MSFFDEAGYEAACRAAAGELRIKFEYKALRAERPEIPARYVLAYVKGDLDPVARNIDQAICGHKFAIDSESDRCYCVYCGIDGDA